MKKTNSDNKLILVSNNEGKAEVRYRKNGESHWNTIYSDETDIDKIISKFIVAFLKKNPGKFNGR